MSKKRREQVIRDLTNTINSEKEKAGGNEELIAKLQTILDSVLDGTYVSKLKKKKK